MDELQKIENLYGLVAEYQRVTAEEDTQAAERLKLDTLHAGPEDDTRTVFCVDNVCSPKAPQIEAEPVMEASPAASETDGDYLPF